MADEKLIQMYADIHATEKYGNTSIKNARYIRPEIQLLKPKSIIDYGCGQSSLVDHLNLGYPVDVCRYDPAIPAFSEKPTGVFDLLINVDVLEHIRDHDLDPIIEEMRALCRNAILIIDTKPAELVLPTGENAHATIQPIAWWADRLGRHFPHLVQIRAARRSRAAFRTWDRSKADDFAFGRMRLQEDARHYGNRVVRAVKKLVGAKPVA